MQTNLDPEKIELMDRYLDHQLKGRALHAFERELANDPELMRELKDYNRFRNSLRSFTGGDGWDYFYLPETRKDIRGRQKRSNFFKAILIILAVAGIILLSLLAYILVFVKPDGLFWN